jgi:hypothetical protein
MWRTDRPPVLEHRLFSTAFVWIKVKVNGNKYVASLHTANGWWSTSNDIHTDGKVMISDLDVEGWQPLSPPDS